MSGHPHHLCSDIHCTLLLTWACCGSWNPLHLSFGQNAVSCLWSSRLLRQPSTQGAYFPCSRPRKDEGITFPFIRRHCGLRLVQGQDGVRHVAILAGRPLCPPSHPHHHPLCAYHVPSLCHNKLPFPACSLPRSKHNSTAWVYEHFMAGRLPKSTVAHMLLKVPVSRS